MERALVSEHPKFNVWYYYLIIVPLFPLTMDAQPLFTDLKTLPGKIISRPLGAIWFVVLAYSADEWPSKA